MARVFPEREVKIASITIGQRHRKDMGDIDALAVSIREKGLLQAIGVDPDHRLVFGERRLRAVRDVLGLATIRAVVVDAPALAVEHDENLIRKEFTPSERVAIAKALKEQLKEQVGERRGRPKKTAEEIVENSPQFEPASGEKTRETAARLAGFGSDHTLRQAEKVVEQGTPELVEAMDAGEVSINAAAEAAELPVEKQREVVEEVRAGKKASEATRKAKGEEEPAVPTDAVGIPLTGSMVEVFGDLAKFNEVASLLRRAQRLIHDLACSPGGAIYRSHLGHRGADDDQVRHYCPHLKNAMNQLKWARPHASRCPYCCREEGSKPSRGCRGCHGLGWVTRTTFDAAPEDYRQAVLPGQEATP